MAFLYPLFFSAHAPTTAVYTLSLHDALPIFLRRQVGHREMLEASADPVAHLAVPNDTGCDDDRRVRVGDRKSTRLNSSHLGISYAVFCLKKKKKETGRAMSHTSRQAPTVPPA